MKKETIMCCSGFTGGVLFCYLLTFYHWLTAPQMLHDGMYGIVFIFSCPPGWFTGSSIASFLLRCKSAAFPHSSATIIIAGTLCCVIGGPIIGTFALMPIGLVLEGLKLLR